MAAQRKRLSRSVAAFVGVSDKSFEEALERAAGAAARNHKGRAFTVVRQEVVLSNPGIGEYRVYISND